MYVPRCYGNAPVYNCKCHPYLHVWQEIIDPYTFGDNSMLKMRQVCLKLSQPGCTDKTALDLPCKHLFEEGLGQWKGWIGFCIYSGLV